MNSCIQRKKLEIVKSLRMQNRKRKEDSAFHLICYAVHYARNKKENKWENDGKLNKDLPNGFFWQLDLVQKQLILNFDFDLLKQQDFLINQVLMNFKFFFVILWTLEEIQVANIIK